MAPTPFTSTHHIAAAPAQRVGHTDVPKLQAVGGLRRQRAAGGDGVAPPLPAALVGGRAWAQQQALRVRLWGLLEEGTQLPLASVALAAGPRARLPIRLAQPVTLVIKSAQHGELEAEVRVWGERGSKSAVLFTDLQSSLWCIKGRSGRALPSGRTALKKALPASLKQYWYSWASPILLLCLPRFLFVCFNPYTSNQILFTILCNEWDPVVETVTKRPYNILESTFWEIPWKSSS